MDPNQYRMFYIRLKSYIASKGGASPHYSTHTVRRERKRGGEMKGREKEERKREEDEMEKRKRERKRKKERWRGRGPGIVGVS